MKSDALYPDFLNELAELALGSRLKRLSETLSSQSAQVYQVFDMPLNPKWFPLLALLDKERQVSIVNASKRLGLSQPALSQFCQQLVQVNLVHFVKDPLDHRRRLVSLTAEGRKVLAQVKPTWHAVELAARQLCEEGGNDFYQSILRFENALSRMSLLERTMAEHQRTKGSDDVENDLSFIDYAPSLAHHFEYINTVWIDEMFVLEDIDKKVLGDPQTHIIDKGGRIYFAKHKTMGIVGACALLNNGEGKFELTKMGVLPQTRGLKVGEKLLVHVIKQAESIPAKLLYLLTNKKCEAAIHLYEKNGFKHDEEIMQTYGKNYARCNVAMRFNPSK